MITEYPTYVSQLGDPFARWSLVCMEAFSCGCVAAGRVLWCCPKCFLVFLS